MRGRDAPLWLLAVAGGVLAVALVTTRSGLGVSTDSAAYLAQARSLRETGSLDMPAGIYDIYADIDALGSQDEVTGTHFPPLYPTVLALSGTATRWLNAFLLMLTALAVAVMVWCYSRSPAVASMAAAVVALSPAVLRTHAMVWSEPLFVALVVIAMLALAGHVESGSTATLVGAALALGLAWLTRYAGVAFVAAGVVVLLRRGRGSRWRRCCAFLVVSAGPMALYVGAMAASGAAGSGYTLAFDRIPPSTAEQAWRALRIWFRPIGTPSAVGLLASLPLAVVPGLLTTGSSRPPSPRLTSLPLLLGCAVVAYLGTVLGAAVVFAEEVHLDERVLAPAYVVAVPLVACLVSGRAVRVPLAMLLATVLAVSAAGGWGLEDKEFAAPSWTDSEIVRGLPGLPESVRVYTNFPEAVFVGVGRHARLLPERDDPAGLARLAEDVQHGRGTVVFYDVGGREELVGPELLAVRLGLPTAADRGVFLWGARP